VLALRTGETIDARALKREIADRIFGEILKPGSLAAAHGR
jgi:hypothetical protein